MTIKEIAQLAGVSISTVSKIVNNKDDNINPETRERVLKIVKEYHYTPYSTVKNLNVAKSFLLGIMLRNASRSYLIVNGILQAAQERGYQILLLDSQNSRETELKNIASLCKNNIDGVLWEPVDESSLQDETYFMKQNITVCHVNSLSAPMALTLDYSTMGYHLTEKLIQYRHSKIACLVREGSRRSNQVFDGFKRCLFDYQIPFHDKMILSVENSDFSSKILANEFSGIVSSHFSSALALYEEMYKMHYYIPYDLSLVSLKDDVRDAIRFPLISSIRIPFLEFGQYCCEQLIDKCEKKEASGSADFLADYTMDHEESLEIPAFFRTKKIIVVGSINTDITFNVDWLPQAGKTTRILNSTTTLGGKGANQSVGVAKLGHQVSLIGEIGNDSDSTMIFDILEKEHVSTQGIHRDMKAQTGKAYIYIEKSGEGTITVLSGANGNLSSEDIRKRQHLFKNAGYCLISTEIPLETAIEAVQTARRYGTETIVKPATLKAMPESLLECIDLFIPNKKEADVLCPQFDTVEKQADFFFHQGIKVVIITLGHHGCYLRTADTAKYYPAASFISIDTTGGADAFISALASYLIAGYDLDRAIRIATYAAGFCISRQGVVPSLIDRNTLETHIKRMEPELL